MYVDIINWIFNWIFNWERMGVVMDCSTNLFDPMSKENTLNYRGMILISILTMSKIILTMSKMSKNEQNDPQNE